ncbi:hypothetical protein K402DRAFT_458157 [Aulographum hederae CBS 113979]|uniref:Myb-like DNA-binding domain-containing protein n=1 Tax=Aulographum hederae CBS 113979 TaxID=1176131 RepID=A0A6G1GKF9_9PEZI|nr:hypothetical protein K402DRAFT_458157 [Aulographum hederae CBS 113979]
MAPLDVNDKLEFLICCIQNTKDGKPDWTVVAQQCNIVSKEAAAKRYERMVKAVNVPKAKEDSNSGDNKAASPSKKAAAKPSSPIKKTPAKPRAPRKAKNAADGETPAKRRKTAVKKSEESVVDDDEEMEEADSKVKAEEAGDSEEADADADADDEV